MTKSEAAALLGVDETAPQPEIERRYKELYSEYQIRLTNAPTATLKKRYAEQIQEVEAAAECLLDGAPHLPGKDLPTDEPTYDPRIDRRTHERLLTPTMPLGTGEHMGDPQRRRTPLAAPEFGQTGSHPALPPPVETERRGFPIKHVGVGIAVVVIAVAASVFIPRGRGGEANGGSNADSVAAVVAAATSDSVAMVNEAIAIANVELGRGAFTDATDVLQGATHRLAWLEQTAPEDTTVIRLRREVQALRDSIFITCAATRATQAAGQAVGECPKP